MSKKIMIWLSLSFLFMAQPVQARPLQVVVSFSIIADWANNIGGKYVHVIPLVAANRDTHDYELSARDLTKLQQADLIIAQGLGFEPYQLSTAIKKYNNKLLLEKFYPKDQLLLLNTGLGAEIEPGNNQLGRFDPHTWHDIRLANTAVFAIYKALCRYDPSHCQFYQQRYQSYTRQLSALNSLAKQLFVNVLPGTLLVTTHGGLQYFAKAHHLSYMSLESSSHHADLSAKRIVKAINEIKKHKTRCIFSEVGSNEQLTQQVARAAGTCVIGKLYTDTLSLSQDAASYIALMKYNLHLLLKGLQ